MTEREDRVSGPTSARWRGTFLRYLAGHPAACTIDFAQWAPPCRSTRAGRQAWAGEVLRRLERDGLATRAPGRDYEIGDRSRDARGIKKRYVSDGMKKPQPSHAWWLTDAGAEHLRQLDAQSSAEAARRSARAGKQAARAQALAELGPLCSPAATAAERRMLAPKLRAAGCTLEKIGSLFGVTREAIRKDLLPEASAASPGGRDAPWVRQLRARVRAGLRKQHATQAGLAEHLGVAPNYLNQVLTGKAAGSPDLLERMAAAVGLRIVILDAGTAAPPVLPERKPRHGQGPSS